jgi:hypothetical protein
MSVEADEDGGKGAVDKVVGSLTLISDDQHAVVVLTFNPLMT